MAKKVPPCKFHDGEKYTVRELVAFYDNAKRHRRKLRNLPRDGKAYEAVRPFVEAKMERCEAFMAKIQQLIIEAKRNEEGHLARLRDPEVRPG